MSEQHKQLVLRFIEAMGASDAKSAAHCLAEDAFTLAKGFSKFAGVRRYETIVGTINAFKKLAQTGAAAVKAADQAACLPAGGRRCIPSPRRASGWSWNS